MKINKYALLVFGIFFVIISFIIVSSENSASIHLNSGKNIITFNNNQPFHVKAFIKLNPDIEVISFNEENQTIGYINIYGGIGEDFLIDKNKTYEIIVGEEIDLIIPENHMEE